jgi:hypothetical protein
MKKIAKLVFKIHRLIYGYPCRSEVRLAIELDDEFFFGLTSLAGVMYAYGKDFNTIEEDTDLSKEMIKEELNEIVNFHKK